MSSSLPIGVFDSGLGGLTVLRELRRHLPGESFVYLGDVARLPYGTKSRDVVTRYAQTCGRFLVDRGVKAVVVACNTATALALPDLRRELGVEVFGVIEPGVRAGLAASPARRVLVLGTESTVRSEAYLRAFGTADSSVRVEQIACPLLVPLAEEGWFEHEVTAQVVATYLARASAFDYDTVVLGCTHYPLLEPSFRRVLSPSIALVHGGAPLAAEVERFLVDKALRHEHGAGSLTFLATDRIPASVPLVGALFDGPVSFELVDL